MRDKVEAMVASRNAVVVGNFVLNKGTKVIVTPMVIPNSKVVISFEVTPQIGAVVMIDEDYLLKNFESIDAKACGVGNETVS